MGLRAVTGAATGLAALLLAAPAAHAELVVDELTTDQFLAKGQLVFFADILDDQGNVIKDQDPAGLKVFIDDTAVPGAFAVDSFSASGQALGISVLMSATRSYALPLGEVGAPSVLDAERTGFANFVKQLGDQDRIAAWVYDETGVRKLQDWSSAPAVVADAVGQLLKAPAGVDPELKPPLYKSIGRVLDAMIEDEANLPRRRLLVVMSDGNDTNSDSASAQRVALRDLATKAIEHGIRIVVLGFTADVPETLVPLGDLAARAQGQYHLLPKFDTLAEDIEAVARQLKNQYVLTFKPAGFTPTDKAYDVRIEVTAKNGQGMKRTVSGVKFPAAAAGAGGTASPPGAGGAGGAGGAAPKKGGCGCEGGLGDGADGLLGACLAAAFIARRRLRA